MLSYVAKELGNRGLAALPEWSSAPLLPWPPGTCTGQTSAVITGNGRYNDRAGHGAIMGSQPPAPTFMSQLKPRAGNKLVSLCCFLLSLGEDGSSLVVAVWIWIFGPPPLKPWVARMTRPQEGKL